MYFRFLEVNKQVISDKAAFERSLNETRLCWLCFVTHEFTYIWVGSLTGTSRVHVSQRYYCCESAAGV